MYWKNVTTDGLSAHHNGPATLARFPAITSKNCESTFATMAPLTKRIMPPKHHTAADKTNNLIKTKNTTLKISKKKMKSIY